MLAASGGRAYTLSTGNYCKAQTAYERCTTESSRRQQLRLTDSVEVWQVKAFSLRVSKATLRKITSKVLFRPGENWWPQKLVTTQYMFPISVLYVCLKDT